jgi:geranylgeranyl diphosphate synthase type I
MDVTFDEFVGSVRRDVEVRLGSWLELRVAEARARGSEVQAVAEGVRELTMRGGKRLRPVLAAAAYQACDGPGGARAVVMAGVALELFQTYLLAHDDLMDGDEVRRGGPSLPALMRAHFGAGQVDAMTILAGDLASAWSQRALFEVESRQVGPERVARAAQELARAHEEVVEGQVLDVRGAARDARQVEAMHALKTASYSVHGPVAVGAALAGAPAEQMAGLAAYAQPLGVAFQLRDDLLGTFGDEAAMGKPAGSDLREGKRSAVIVDALASASAAGPVERVLGRRDATSDELRAALASIEASGTRGRIEARIGELAVVAREALERTPLAPSGRALLAHAIHALTERRA